MLKKMARWLLLVFFSVLLGVSGFKIYETVSGYMKGQSLYKQTAEAVTKTPPPAQSGTQVDTSSPLEVDFEALWQQNEDVVAWLYCPDTVINYPILQGRNNDQYLRHMIDGSYNESGSIFLEAENNAAFTDLNTIIYGHNMKDKSMFGTFSNYMKQEYFDEHPVLWLITPQQTYQIQLFAGFTIPYDDEVYTLFNSVSAMQNYLDRASHKSTFTPQITTSAIQQMVTLSTCSYAYDNARYVLVGSLVAVD